MRVLFASEKYDVCDESVVEESHAGEGHDNALLITLFDNQIITDGSAGFCNVLNTRGISALDVIGEGEESIAAQGNILAGIQPCALLIVGQRFGTLCEVVLPDTRTAILTFFIMTSL